LTHDEQEGIAVAEDPVHPPIDWTPVVDEITTRLVHGQKVTHQIPAVAWGREVRLKSPDGYQSGIQGQRALVEDMRNIEKIAPGA